MRFWLPPSLTKLMSMYGQNLGIKRTFWTASSVMIAIINSHNYKLMIRAQDETRETTPPETDNPPTCPLWTGVDGLKEVCRTSSLPSQLLLWNFQDSTQFPGLASEERGGDNTSPHTLFHQNCFLFLLMSGRKAASFSGTVYVSASLTFGLCMIKIAHCCCINAPLEGKHEL